MNKILKILSILFIGFVMFSCSTPTNDPEIQTYSITFATKDSTIQFFVDYLNTLPEFKNLEEGTEVQLPWVLYANVNLEDESIGEISKTETDNSNYVIEPYLGYYNAHIGVSTDSSKRLRSVTLGNEDIVIQIFNYDVISIDEYHQNSN